MRSFSVIILVILVLPLAVVGEIRILVPPEYCSLSGGTLRIVGEATGDSVHVFARGRLVDAAAVRDSVFHVSLRLPLGLNHIQIAVSDTLDGTVVMETRTLDVISGPSPQGGARKFFRPYKFHDENIIQECDRCHNDEDEEQFSMTGCGSCHEQVVRRFRAHALDVEMDCLVCHPSVGDQSAADSGFDNPCYSCHENKIESFSKEYVHGPVAGGSCTVCHDPHSSRFEKLLHSPTIILCSSCHDVSEEMEMVVQHQPFDEGTCNKCHDPHATNNRWVLVRKSSELCRDCHGKFLDKGVHSHPFNVKPEQHRQKRLFLDDQGNLECVSCHSPHASNAAHLLRTDQENTCIGCHPKY